MSATVENFSHAAFRMLEKRDESYCAMLYIDDDGAVMAPRRIETIERFGQFPATELDAVRAARRLGKVVIYVIVFEGGEIHTRTHAEWPARIAHPWRWPLVGRHRVLH